MTIREDIIKKMKQIGCSEERVKHSIEVSDLALKMAGKMEEDGIKIDKGLIEKGALLHDIGYVKSKMDPIELPEYKASGLRIPAYDDLVRHQQIGAQMIIDMGFPKSVALISLRHDAIILKNDERKRLKIEPVPEEDITVKTFEEKAVLYADMLVFLRLMGLNPWGDPREIRDIFLPLIKYVSECAGEEELRKILMKRIDECLDEARKYVKREFFIDKHF